MNRRQAVKALGGLAGAATMSKFLSGCGDDGGGNNDVVGITNYVYLMLENRTYDHVFGSRKLVEGRGGDGLTAEMANADINGAMISSYAAASGELCVLDPPHGWDASHAQWNNGAMDGFVKEYQRDHGGRAITDVMSYLTRSLVPVSYALADAYTTCDRWFASVMGPTLPNRAYWHAATSFGLQANMEVLNKFSSVPVPTIYNRLEDKGVDWAYYSGPLAVVSLLGNPGPYQLDITGKIKRFSAYPDMPEDPNGEFFADAAAGRLPAVTYIDPFFGENDDHPPGHPILAQALIAAVYRALATSPQWKNCMLVITYDEHGGFYDHVAPPTTTDDSLEKFGVDGFQQCGFRVPAMVVGPYAKQNYVSSVQYDHTSALKHLQNAFGLETLTPRMNAANDLTDCIDMDRLAAGEPADPIELPKINLADYPMITDPVCRGSAFRKDPITEWADANPGSVIDRRSDAARDTYHRGIVEYLRKAQG
ncbi:MAG: alkaline phosphatase family protein [Deltaproteobacteria bacterium]|nr:alkaline phosphatase family protein [Deltaproteobacteria bacterium]